MVSLKELGERELIRNVLNIIRPPPGLGPGDDSALIPRTDGDVVACTDSVSFERHFPREMSYECFGWTAAAVNISDLAAMGAEPAGLLAAVMMPQDLDERHLYDIMSGMDRCAEAFGTYIYGGDTKPGPGSISCTAIGSMGGRRPMLRSGARPGDVVAVTGSLGSAAAGFFALGADRGNDAPSDESPYSAMLPMQRSAVSWPERPPIPLSPLMMPMPRVREGVCLSASGAVTSCIDLSDGLAEGAKSICRASHAGMDIHTEFLPEGDGVDTVSSELGIPKEEMMLYWGGDYELLFTFAKDRMDALYGYDIDFSVIGKVTNDNTAYVTSGGRRTVMGDGRH